MFITTSIPWDRPFSPQARSTCVSLSPDWPTEPVTGPAGHLGLIDSGGAAPSHLDQQAGQARWTHTTQVSQAIQTLQSVKLGNSTFLRKELQLCRLKAPVPISGCETHFVVAR